METETVKTVMPKEIHALEYAGFWDFNTDGFYGPSLLNIEDNKDAEQVANEIARRYNSHYELVEALQWALNNLNPYDKPSPEEIEKYNKAVAAVQKATK